MRAAEVKTASFELFTLAEIRYEAQLEAQLVHAIHIRIDNK